MARPDLEGAMKHIVEQDAEIARLRNKLNEAVSSACELVETRTKRERGRLWLAISKMYEVVG